MTAILRGGLCSGVTMPGGLARKYPEGPHAGSGPGNGCFLRPTVQPMWRPD